MCNSLRLVLGLCGLLLSVESGWGQTAPAPSAPARKPNILWICADDLAPYALGAYGSTRVKTPNLDSLFSSGMRFDRAYCNCPVCTASRQSFLTGRYPRSVGVTQLRTPLLDSETTLAEMLAGAGYVTAAFGKMHFNSNLRHGFELRWDQPDYQTLLKKRGRQPLPEGIEVLPPWRPFRDPARVWLNADVRPQGLLQADMFGTCLAEQAVDFLHQKHDRPFFLMVSFTEPHSPFHFPVEYQKRHTAEEFTAPEVGPEDDDQIPAIFRELTAADKQGIAAAYHTSVEFLDANVGRVLEALKAAGQWDHTIIVVLGDHGYFLGQHGRIEKHSLFEEAIRAPLGFSYSQQIAPGSSTAALVEFLDVVPTLLDLAGVPIPPSVQGRSLKEVLQGRATSHRERIFVEYAENEEALVGDAHWRLIYGTGKRLREDGYGTGRPLPGRTIRLYDLDTDPQERRNLAQEPAQAERVQQMTGHLVEHLRRTARQPELIPATDDPHALLEFLLQPRDPAPPRDALPPKAPKKAAP